MKRLFQTLTVTLGILSVTSMMGCSKQQHVDSKDYLRCNKSSNGVMAEIESGYLRVHNNIVFYADKDNLDLWVPLCSNPDCLHSTKKPLINGGVYCNGYTKTNRIIQKDGKIYDTAKGDSGMVDIVEIAIDGSGSKKVYEVPWDEKSYPDGGTQALYQDCILLSRGYLDEMGNNQYKLIRVRDDENGEVEVDTLYEGENLSIFSGNTMLGIKGDNVVAADIQWEADSGKDFWHNLWKFDGEELVKLNIPDEINLLSSYLSGNELTYYETNDGFYKLNIETGEKQLIEKMQLKDSRACIYSDDLIFEYNCYSDHTPEEEMCIKMYNGKEWKDVQLPEEITNTKRICTPSAWASDRIFFACRTDNQYIADMYYMMLDEKNPKLVYGGQIADKPWAEEYEKENQNKEEESNGSEEKVDFDEITIFDNEDGVLKITGARQDGKNYIVDFFFEVGDSEREYKVTIEALINGIQCHTNIGLESRDPDFFTHKITFGEDTLKEYGVTDIYSIEEFTDIELIFYVNEWENYKKGEEILRKSIHIYPQGEDAAVHYTREPQEMDLVVVDNEKVKVTVVGYETTKVENDTPIFFIENKTEQDIQFSVEAGSLNGYQDNAIRMMSDENIQPGACAFKKLIFGRIGPGYGVTKNFWEEHDVTEIGIIKTLINIGYFDVGKFKDIGDPFVKEVATLYPQGEENARNDGRKPQETDVVLVENDYIKMTLIGYQEYEESMSKRLPNAHAKIVVENKTDEILYSYAPVNGDNGMIEHEIYMEWTLLPGDNYLHVISSISSSTYQSLYPEGQLPIISKIEFLYQVVDEDKNILCQEYIDLYPLGEEQAEIYQIDTSAVEEVVVDNEMFTIAVIKYSNYFDEEHCLFRYCFVNKTDKMVCFEMDDIWANGVEHIIEVNEWTVEKFVAFPQETTFVWLDVYDSVKNANTTEIEDVEMTFNVYDYNYQDGSVGEKLGSETVKFGPK